VNRLARTAPFVLAALFVAHGARASALDKIARELAQAVGDVPQGTTVVASPLVSDVPVAKPDDLAVRLAALVAGRVAKGAKPSDRAAPLAVARTQAKDSAALLFVAPTLDKGQLRATIDFYPVPHNGWDRIRTPVPAPRAHGYAASAIDAEVRKLLDESFSRAVGLLGTHRAELDTVANTLLERERLDRAEFEEIVGARKSIAS